MSVSRPAQRLVGRCLASSSRTRSPVPSSTAAAALKQFSTSISRPAKQKRRSQFRNVKASELGLDDPAKFKEYQEAKFPEYTDAEKEILSGKYTPEQMEALEAGEKAIDVKDMVWQGRFRDDMFMPEYIDDYAKRDPRYDLKPPFERQPEDFQFPKDDKKETDKMFDEMWSVHEKHLEGKYDRAMIRAMRAIKKSEGEEMIDLTFEELDAMEKDPDLLKKYVEKDGGVEKAMKGETPAMDPKDKDQYLSRAQMMRLGDKLDDAFDEELRKLREQNDTPDMAEFKKNDPDGLISLHSAEQPDLGKIPGVAGKYKISQTSGDNMDDGQYDAITLATGLTVPEIKSLFIKTLAVRWVSNQTRLGKVRSYSVICVAGNGDGRIGIGQGKSTDMAPAVLAAQGLAIRSMKPIRRYENRTTYGKVTTKISGTIAQVESRPPGFGLRVPSRVFEMCRAAGIYDLAIQFPRSKSPMNTVKAVYKAFLEQPDPEQIAIGRGKKLVDARKVYYGGASM